MAIRVAIDDAPKNAPKLTARDEPVYLPGMAEDDEPYIFHLTGIKPILIARRRARGLPANEAIEMMELAQEEWLQEGFGNEDWEEIQARLDDPKDVLNDFHIEYVVEQLLQEGGDRPTTSSNAASRRRRARQAQAAQSTKESTSEN